MAVATRRRSGWRRRLGAFARFVAALALVGGVYTAFAPGVYAEETDESFQALVEQGEELFNNSCISCHGVNAEGVDGRGPSLIGVGSASVEFQVNSGRMPMAAQTAQAERKPPMFTPEEATAIAAYIQSLGGGPQTPDNIDAMVADVLADPTGLAEGGDLFRVNCSSCHGFSTGGGALSSGGFAPSLAGVPTEQLYQAMLTGPQNMPVFADNQLTPEQKAQVIAYIEYLNTDQDPGGWGLGRFGPSTEGIAIFLVGITTLAVATLWIAGKS
ncbi:ubiquinol-cytochrome c reductase cytochrome c subunit [Stackebrandtia albiflava]|uniref:Cytochrome bc1 complex cytochrome c subunit n=1 Tax=Stackebrandtia albiflava TaxID=406432 RepID=A0A562VBG3_9ACTN|nr:cytochrome c [Stackebrandtia albiflava]TWJ15151.1 ubiquinol-cytochrome c reductase cytochrome c subunit [Stackebrandtia albiflava]